MSYAWKQLRRAVRALSGAGPQRECLINAYIRLMEMKPKDLPAEIRPDFATLTQNIPPFPRKNIRQAVRTKVSLLADAEVASKISAIINMYDVVARYQPMPPAQAKARMKSKTT